MLPSVSVVIPTYRRRDSLQAVVEPLLADPAAEELIVVVDGCHDGSLELLQKWIEREPRIKPVWRENGGEGAARQTGLERSVGEVVLFLDDDVVAEPGLVAGHAENHRNRFGLVVLGFMPVALPLRRQPGQFATYLYDQEYRRICAGYEDGSAEVLKNLWAGNFSLRRQDALRVGMQAPGFRGLYHADQEFGLRCRAAGLQGVFDRSLAARHVHHRPLTAFRRDARAQGAAVVRLSVVHPETTRESSDGYLLRGLPRPLIWLLQRFPPFIVPLAAVLARLTAAAGFCHLWTAETTAARLLRRVEQVRGARSEREGQLPR